MNFSFFKKSNRCLGIDISAKNIKVVQLTQESKRLKLETYGYLKIKDFVQETEVENRKINYSDKTIAMLLRKVLKECKATTKRAIVSTPASSTFSVLIKMPKMSDEEAERAIPIEAKKYIPVPIEEVILSWEILKKNSEEFSLKENSDSHLLEVILVAVSKELVQKYAKIAEIAKVELVALESESFSLARALVGKEKEPIAIIDIGTSSSNIIIIEGGFVVMSRTIEMSGNELTKVIADGLNLNFKRAEVLKKDIGIKTDDAEKQISELMLPLINSIIEEIQRVFELYYQRSNKKPKMIIMAGGSANLPGLTEYFIENFDIPVSLANPWLNVIYPEILTPALKELSPFFSSSVGSAIRGTV